ncbi:NUDIX hydrolase [Ignavibacteriales bacterium]
MAISRWKKIKGREYHRNPFWSYRIDDFVIPSKGFKGKYYFVHTNGSSMVIPINEGNNLLLVNQYRYLNKRFSLEFPCGGIKTDSTPEETANFELREETGYSAKKVTKVGKFCPFNGVTDENCHVFLARDLVPDTKKPDDTEELTVEEVTIPQFETMISQGKIFDGMTLSAWALAKHTILKRLK